MDYEKKYKDALAIAREIHRNEAEKRFDMEWLFPELKESEDERIRKSIICGMNALKEQGKETFATIPINDCIAWLEKQGKPQDKGEISDGYHTFNELYYYRMLYNAAFFNMLPKEWVHKSKRHNDGEECFGGGWFIVMANLPTGQISNHYELKYWDLFQIPEKEVADKWDGHTPQEAADRLHKYLLEKQSEQKPFDYKHATITQKDGERIRKELIKVFSNREKYLIDQSFGDITVSEALAWLKKQGGQKTAVTDFNAKDWYVSKVDGKIHDMTYNPTDKVEPKFKVKYAGSEYNVLEVKDIAGVTFYGIEDEPNHIDYVKADNCEIISGYGIKENGSPYPTKPSMFSEQKPAWSEEDENYLQSAENACEYQYGKNTSTILWLKHLKDRVQPKPKEWNEEEKK